MRTIGASPGIDRRAVAVPPGGGAAAGEVAASPAARTSPGGTAVLARAGQRRPRPSAIAGRAAREVEHRRAAVVQQPAELVQVVHHAQVGRLAVGLERLAAVPPLGVVPELVHQRRRLHERRADRPAADVVEAAERDLDVATGEVGDAGVGPRLEEVGVDAAGAHAVHVVGGLAAGKTRQLGLRQPDRVREERVVERVHPRPIEASLAGAAGHVARIAAARTGWRRRHLRDRVAQEAEARLPADGARIAAELAHPRRVVRPRGALRDRLVDALAAGGALVGVDQVVVRIGFGLVVGADVEVHRDRRRCGAEGVAHQPQCVEAGPVRVRRPGDAAVAVAGEMRLVRPGLHEADLDEDVLAVGEGTHRLEVGQRLAVGIEDRGVRRFPAIQQAVAVEVLHGGAVDDRGPGQAPPGAGAAGPLAHRGAHGLQRRVGRHREGRVVPLGRPGRRERVRRHLGVVVVQDLRDVRLAATDDVGELGRAGPAGRVVERRRSTGACRSGCWCSS